MERFSDYLTIKEAAALLGVSQNTLRRNRWLEEVPEFRHPINNYRLYRRRDLEEFYRRLTAPIEPRHQTERREAAEGGAVP